ncbi:PIN domain-containing protein [Sphingomonas sp.]|uniref:PIN domain-containing protein n=1 Tax=Sphingomonas sp. TaxID=28214 RepID=UPI000DAFB7F6|nr:PIN domain-containing protein [Sphingomonas sp.]PZU08635.1 MAG: DUF4411 domain-containing protein [Sphingomonas sp.]
MYVFDTSPLSTLFKNYYPSRFPTLWERFDALVADSSIVSTREVMRECLDGPVEALRDWSVDKNDFYQIPVAAEGAFVAQIYGVVHFQQNIEQQKLLKGGRNADPFVIALANCNGRTVVTMEKAKPNGAKIPNICAHFGIACLTLEEFMEQEGWQF